MLLIEESYRNQGIGNHFLKQLERWLTHQGINMLHTLTPPETYNFYKPAGYIPTLRIDSDNYIRASNDMDLMKVL